MERPHYSRQALFSELEKWLEKNNQNPFSSWGRQAVTTLADTSASMLLCFIRINSFYTFNNPMK